MLQFKRPIILMQLISDEQVNIEIRNSLLGIKLVHEYMSSDVWGFDIDPTVH